MRSHALQERQHKLLRICLNVSFHALGQILTLIEVFWYRFTGIEIPFYGTNALCLDDL